MDVMTMFTQDDDYFDILTKAISKLKRVLEKLDPSSSGAEKMASSTFYLIATHPRTGLTCCHLSQDQAAIQCGFLTCENLAEFPISFKQVQVLCCMHMFDVFLIPYVLYCIVMRCPSIVLL